MRYILYLIAVTLSVACTTTKQTTAVTKPAPPAQKKSTPEFLDNIAITKESGDRSQETLNVKREKEDVKRETSNVKKEISEILVSNVEADNSPIENFSSLRMKYSILLNTPVEE